MSLFKKETAKSRFILYTNLSWPLVLILLTCLAATRGLGVDF